VIGKVAQFVCIGAVIMLIASQGRDSKNFFGKIMGGVKSLMDITNYFSDILSYSRIFALCLATAVMGMVINIIVGLLTDMGVVGWVLAIVAFTGAHLFSLAINALGAFVHASRLQYIEFYSKFLEGGGRPFKPFQTKTKYYAAQNGR